MNCGDGYLRPDNGCWAKSPVAKTAAYTIQALETGTIFTNTGASDAVTFTLPTPKAGMWFMFVKTVIAKNLVLQMPANVTVNGGTAAQVYKHTATTETAPTCMIVGISATEYIVAGEKGTWANAAS